jgi:hypothetical protein
MKTPVRSHPSRTGECDHVRGKIASEQGPPKN